MIKYKHSIIKLNAAKRSLSDARTRQAIKKLKQFCKSSSLRFTWKALGAEGRR